MYTNFVTSVNQTEAPAVGLQDEAYFHRAAALVESSRVLGEV